MRQSLCTSAFQLHLYLSSFTYKVNCPPYKIKANGRNDTGRKQYRNMQRKERQKEKVNTMFKEYFYSLFLCSRPIIHFFEQYIPLVHTYNPLVTNIIYHQQHYTFNFLGFFLHNGAEL
nr:MAG TPA: hypothetical protein [Caudoviricetes sp.]